MAFQYSPKVVTDNLVLYLDGANPRSYVSGSSIWTDLGKNNVNGTLTGGPSYNSANGGVVSFDGNNDYMSITLPTIGTNYTISIWLKILTLPNPATETQVFASSTDIASISIFGGKFGSWNGSVYRQPNTILAANTWYNLVMVNTTNTVFYINGAEDGTFASTGTLDPGAATFAAINGQRWLNAQFGTIKFYSKGLSSTEVFQNYSTTKSRFGL